MASERPSATEMLAIVGGAGLHELSGLDVLVRIAGHTPLGKASGDVLRGRSHDREPLFFARHGSGHRLLPHGLTCRANTFAFTWAGAMVLLGFWAVGLLVLAKMMRALLPLPDPHIL